MKPIHLLKLLIPGVLFILVNGLFASSAWGSAMPRLAICNCYSDASFAYSAEQASLRGAPWFEGVDPVYVLNPHSEDIRYFDVHRWVDDGYQPRSAGRDGTFRSTAMRGYFRADAVPGIGDPDVIAEITTANSAVKSFVHQLHGGISIGDLGLSYSSAVSLVGPEDSAAGYRRGALRNALNAHLNSEWNLIKMTLSDLALRAAGAILSNSNVRFLSNITIEFPDGTTIQIDVVRINDGILGSDVFFELDVRTDTIYGPGLTHVPQSAGQFNGFSYSGDNLTIQELIRLARLYGIPVTGPGGGDTFKCEIDGSEIKCRVTGK